MRILADTSIWFRFVMRLPLPAKVEAALDDPSNNRFLSPMSSMEILRKWQSGKLPSPDPALWIDDALQGFQLLDVTEPIARKAALWDWEHRDPADRIIAATAQVHGIELWHNDVVLEKLKGFPQRYFKSAPL